MHGLAKTESIAIAVHQIVWQYTTIQELPEKFQSSKNCICEANEVWSE